MTPAQAAGELVVDRARIEFVSRREGTRRVAVDEVSFVIDPAEFIALVGPSGCGKSSLMMAAAGLLSLTSGTITVSGKQVTGPGGHDRAMVFQAPTLLPWRTVAGNAVYGLEMMKVDKRTARRTAQEMIDLVGLSGHESNYPHELSGGMQQRVNLARALATDPLVLLMDEPFAALDAQTREVMQAELLRIWSEMRKSVLFVTHQIDEAIFLADRVVAMGPGPGSTIAKVLDVPFGRPRPQSIRHSPEFAELTDEIWAAIRG